MSTQDIDQPETILIVEQGSTNERAAGSSRAVVPPGQKPSGPRSANDAETRTERLLAARDDEGRPSVPDRDWREEVFYFLLPDRFNARYEFETQSDPEELRKWECPKELQLWDLWAVSGRNRFQGGNIGGIIDKLPYLSELGVTALWVGPVWKQRAAGLNRNVGRSVGTRDDPLPKADWLPQQFFDAHQPVVGVTKDATVRASLCPSDDYHGYAIMDFLEVDPRFGTAEQLRELVAEAHKLDMRVILDIVINHSGENWLYDCAPLDTLRPPYLEGRTDGRVDPIGDHYELGAFLDAANRPLTALEAGRHLPGSHWDDGVWPMELQDPEMYNRRGFHDYGGVDDFKADDPLRLADWMNRDFRYEQLAESPMLEVMLKIWRYWIAYTDCDGFRVDTFKHVPMEVSRSFTERITEFANERMGKSDFFVVGEVGGKDQEGADYLARNAENLRVLEVGERRDQLRKVAVGDVGDARYVLMPTRENISARTLSDRVMTSIDDHDNLGTALQRFARRSLTKDGPASANPSALVPALALLFFGPGIPCLYYGTEQALTGPIGPDALEWLRDNEWGIQDQAQAGDRYLREAMFAPQHPRLPGIAGMGSDRSSFDDAMPGFSPGGPGQPAVFDEGSDTFKVAKNLIAVRKDHRQLWAGDIEVCAVSQPFTPFELVPQTIVAWTRTTANPADEFAGALIVVDTRSAGRSECYTVQIPPLFSQVETLRHIVSENGDHPSLTGSPLPPLTTEVQLQTDLRLVHVTTSPHSVSVFVT